MSWLRRKSPEEKRAIKELKEREDIAIAEAWMLHKQRMEKAAGVSSVTFVCHPDTWGFIFGAARENHNFSVARETTAQPDGLASVPVPGPSLVAILEALWWKKRNKYVSVGENAIAKRIYDLVGSIVDAIDPEAEKGAPVPPVVIDAKHGTAAPDR